MDQAQQLGFTASHRVVLLILSMLLLALVLELVRRRRFKERYALLWLASSGFGLVMGLFPGIIVWISHFIHVQFLTVVFGLSFIFLLGLVLSFSVVISRLSDQNHELAQEVALLSARIEQIENERHTPGNTRDI